MHAVADFSQAPEHWSTFFFSALMGKFIGKDQVKNLGSCAVEKYKKNRFIGKTFGGSNVYGQITS